MSFFSSLGVQFPRGVVGIMSEFLEIPPAEKFESLVYRDVKGSKNSMSEEAYLKPTRILLELEENVAGIFFAYLNDLPSPLKKLEHIAVQEYSQKGTAACWPGEIAKPIIKKRHLFDALRQEIDAEIVRRNDRSQLDWGEMHKYQVTTILSDLQNLLPIFCRSHSHYIACSCKNTIDRKSTLTVYILTTNLRNGTGSVWDKINRTAEEYLEGGQSKDLTGLFFD